MTDFRKGFFLAPKKQEPGMQQKFEETKKLQKMTHDTITSSKKRNRGNRLSPPYTRRSQNSIILVKQEWIRSSKLYQTSGRGQNTPQRKYQADRTHKQWTSRYFRFEWLTRRGRSMHYENINENSSVRLLPSQKKFRNIIKKLNPNSRVKNKKYQANSFINSTK